MAKVKIGSDIGRIRKLQPGDELLVCDGVYENWYLEIQCNGTKDKPIVIRPATAGGVLFRRETRIILAGNYLILKGFHFEHCSLEPVVGIHGGSYNRITECRFMYCGDPQINNGHILSIVLGSYHNRVDHCHFEGSKSMSLVLAATNELTTAKSDRVAFPMYNCIDHNTFCNIFPHSENGQETILVHSPRIQGATVATNNIIEFNIFDNAAGDPYETISNKSSANIYRYNVFVNGAAPMGLREGEDCLVEGNLFLHNSTGLVVYGMRHRIINNVFVAQGQAILMPLGGGGHKQAEGCLVAHNTFMNQKGYSLAFCKNREGYHNFPKNNRIINNLFCGKTGMLLFENGAVQNETINNLFWATEKAEAGSLGMRAIEADPCMSGKGIAVCPGLDGAAAGRAVPLTEVKLDRHGRLRSRQNPDIGADEVSCGRIAEAQVLMPVMPPVREPFNVDSYKGKCFFAFDAHAPTRGWLSDKQDNVLGENGVLKLADSSVWLEREAPAEMFLQWEYNPALLSSIARISFSAAKREGGYTLQFGGATSFNPNRPKGIVTLSKGDSREVIAEGHDTVLAYEDFWDKGKNSILPDPNLWYKCSLFKCAEFMRLDIGDIPIMIWNDTGRMHGSAYGAGAIGLSQFGTGSWRNICLWELALGAEEALRQDVVKKETPYRRFSLSGVFKKR